MTDAEKFKIETGLDYRGHHDKFMEWLEKKAEKLQSWLTHLENNENSRNNKEICATGS
jgi:hypothetical protein